MPYIFLMLRGFYTISRLTACGLLLFSLFAALPALADQLTVRVDGLRSGDGIIRVALWRPNDKFPDSNSIFLDATVPAAPDGVAATFDNMQPGAYAIAVFHDENANGEFDQGLLGIPIEGYGFAKNAPVFLSPPNFNDAAVILDGTPVVVCVTMRY